MRKPRALRPGDRLAVVAPASPFARDEFDAGIEEIRSLGFEPVFDNSVFERQAYVAGPADVRADAWLRAWRDPSVAALIAARGGYGSVQILPMLAGAGTCPPANSPTVRASTDLPDSSRLCSTASSSSYAISPVNCSATPC